MFKSKILLIVSILWISCKSAEEFSGFSYDPPGATVTTDKIIESQKYRIIGAGVPKVWISNEFESARLSDFYQIDANTFEVLIRPENVPINNSPWYAFDIWSDSSWAINLRIAYEPARHRYEPKIQSSNGTLYSSHIIHNATYDSSNGSTTFPIFLSQKSQTVSGQLLKGIRYSDLLASTKTTLPAFVSIDTVGFSHQNRAILQFEINETKGNSTGLIILLSRQHPPEVSGYLAYQAFWDELTTNTELASTFRKHFKVMGFPIINPDGVVNGHWRHNAAGIDLNRDWKEFNQPETRAIRDALLPILGDKSTQVFYGIDFHSTNENILYPIEESVITSPDNFTQRWAKLVKRDNPELNFVSEEFNTDSPISKNWIYNTFGADAVTFEVDDEMDRAQIKKLGKNTAQSFMQLMLNEWNELQNK